MTARRDIEMSRAEAGPLIKSGRLTPAFLYEMEHCRDGSVFVYVELTKGMTMYYRLRPERVKE